MFDWNDLRYFIAVARAGSTLAAGRSMRVSQTTVSRRIAALEQSLGLLLFDRRQAGYALTPAGKQLLDHAIVVEQAALSFAEAAGFQSRDNSGTVRVTTSDIFSNTFLPPWLAELHEAHPDIRIELDECGTVRDLGAGEADVAIRSTAAAAPAGVVGRRICPDEWTFYCSRDYAARHGIPRTRAELHGHALVGGGGVMTWRAYEAILQEIGIAEQVAIQQATMTGLLTGVRSGLGIGALPCFIAEGEDDLIRCMRPRAEPDRWIWLLTHERVRHSPPVRTVVDFLYERMKRRVRDLNLAH